MSNRVPVLLWVLSCITVWAWLARDLVTVVFCTAVTMPYTIYLIREARDRKTAKPLA